LATTNPPPEKATGGHGEDKRQMPEPNAEPKPLNLEDVTAAVARGIADFKAGFLKTDLPTALKGVTEQITGIVSAVEALKPKPDADKDKDKGDPQLNAQIADLTKLTKTLEGRVNSESEARKKAEEKADLTERQSALLTAVGKYAFANDASRASFVRGVTAEISRTESGELVAGGLPLEKFVDEQLAAMPNLLAPKEQRGAGAGPGGKPAVGGKASLDEIKQGMTAADRVRILGATRVALGVGQ